MNVLKKFFTFIKSVFDKHNNVKKLVEPKELAEQDKKANFVKDLKVNVIEKETKKNITTLICNGDGLGIKKKISW